MVHLFEYEIGTLLIAFEGVEKQWYDSNILKGNSGIEFLEKLNKDTLGRLLGKLKKYSNHDISSHIVNTFTDALKERNYLFHHFFTTHALKIGTKDGIQFMVDDLKRVHNIVLKAHNIVNGLTSNMLNIIDVIKNKYNFY